MSQHDDKHLDRLTKKIVKEASLESPSLSFTDDVMSQIKALEVNNVTVYKPLITKIGWVFISLILFATILYILFGANTESIGWFSNIDLSILSNFELPNIFSGIIIPKTVTYAVVLFGFMLSIQVLFLKRHFNKQYE